MLDENLKNTTAHNMIWKHNVGIPNPYLFPKDRKHYIEVKIIICCSNDHQTL